MTRQEWEEAKRGIRATAKDEIRDFGLQPGTIEIDLKETEYANETHGWFYINIHEPETTAKKQDAYIAANRICEAARYFLGEDFETDIEKEPDEEDEEQKEA